MPGEEEAAREAEVESIMAGGQVRINRYMITTMMDIKKNGCAQACKSSTIANATPAAIGTALMGIIYGVSEWFQRRG